MSYTIKLLIPIGLGIAAAMVNWWALSSGARPVEFITVTRQIQAGEMIDPGVLKRLEIPARFSNLKGVAPLYTDRGVLSGQIAQRTLEPDDIVFFRDTLLQGIQLDLHDNETALAVRLGNNSQPPGLLRVGMQVSFKISMPTGEPGRFTSEWVGPFRLVAVDASMTQGVGAKLGARPVEQVLVAVGTTLDDKALKLDDFCDRLLRGEVDAPRLRIDDPGL